MYHAEKTNDNSNNKEIILFWKKKNYRNFPKSTMTEKPAGFDSAGPHGWPHRGAPFPDRDNLRKTRHFSIVNVLVYTRHFSKVNVVVYTRRFSMVNVLLYARRFSKVNGLVYTRRFSMVNLLLYARRFSKVNGLVYTRHFSKVNHSCTRVRIQWKFIKKKVEMTIHDQYMNFRSA